MNLPNKLTVTRFVLTAVFLVLFFTAAKRPDLLRYGYTLSLVVFIAASLTDFWDGEVARRYNLITNFGILMDPLADKVLICSAFIAFVETKHIAAWMVVIIVARELAITGLRLLAAAKQHVIAAEKYGKHKTISQIVATIAVLTLVSYPEWGSVGAKLFNWWVPQFTQIAIWLSVILTATSGALYLWKNRAIYLSDK